MGILMCEICGKRFPKVSDLYWHQTSHNMEFKQFHKNIALNIAVFSVCGIDIICGSEEPGGGAGREIYRNVITVDQSGMTNHHHTFSGIEILESLFFMNAKQIDDYWEAIMTSYASRQQQINRETDSQGSNIVNQLNTVSLHVRAKDAIIMRTATSSEVIESSSAMHLNLQGTTDAQAAPAGPEPSCRVSTNEVPKEPAALQEAELVTGTQQQAPPPNIPEEARSAVSAIMKNLKAMKSLNNKISDQIASSRAISLSQLNREVFSSVKMASTATIIPPLNHSELEKRGHPEEMNAQSKQASEVVPKRNQLCEFSEPLIQPARNWQKADSVAVAEGRGERGKVPTQNKHKNDFLLSQPSSKRRTGIQNPPNQPFYRETVPSTSSVLWTNTKSPAAAATESVAGSGKLVGIATASTTKAKGGRGEMPPQKTSSNRPNGFNSIQASAKNDEGVQTKRKSTKLAHGRVVPPTSTVNSSSKKAVAAAACVTGHGREVVAQKTTVSSKKRPYLFKTSKKRRRGMMVTLEKLKKVVPTMPGKDYLLPDLPGIGSYTDIWGNHYWNCMVCDQAEPKESSKDMICCDECEKWYHYECLGISENIAEDVPWYCKICIYKVCGYRKDIFPELFKND